MNKRRGAIITVTSREKFVKSIYASMDEAITGGLHRLRVEEGLQPTCIEGCCHCCRYYILTNMAEAHTLAQYVKREWKEEELDALRISTQQWHAWDHSRPGRRPLVGVDEQADLSQYKDGCPLLVNGACSVYPVRPAVCRRHFVSSPPLSCQAAIHPGSSRNPPLALTSLVEAADPFCEAIRDHVEKAGWDYDRTLMLLPQWLAIEMGWNFGVSL